MSLPSWAVRGQKVVCVDNKPRACAWKGSAPVSAWLKVGAVYVIRRTSDRRNPLIWLEGISRLRKVDGVGMADSGFHADRFRLISRRKTDISPFTRLLSRARQTEHV
jgi:hypothetical protein